MKLSTFLNREVDFTKGNNAANLLLFAIPIILGALLQNLYHSADTVVLGNYVGAEALAAANVSGTLTNLLIGFCTGMSAGCTVVVAKAQGKGDKKELEKKIAISYTFSIVLGVLASVLGFLLIPLMIKVSSMSGNVAVEAKIYLKIFIGGLIFTIIYNNTAGIFRALGDMMSPFFILLFTCTLNIVLDLVFSIVFNAGIAGVAAATVICQFISVVMGTVILYKKKGFKCFAGRNEIKEGWNTIKDTMDIGISAGIQSSIISFSNIFVWRYINSYSTAIVAGVGIGHRIDNFLGLPATGFEAAITTFTSQNIGAGQNKRIKGGIRSCLIIAISMTFLLNAIIYPFAPQIASIFNKEKDVMQPAIDMMRLLMPLYFTNTVRQILTGVLRAYKKSSGPMILSIAGMVVLRQICLAVTKLMGQKIIHVYISYPLGWISAFLFVLAYYIYEMKKIRRNKTTQ